MLEFLWENFFRTKQDSIKNFLSEQAIFAYLSPKEIRLIERLVHHRSYFPGETIFKPSSSIGMYMIIKGKVHISYEDNDKQKAPLIVSRLAEKDFFGELSLVQESSYQKTTAVAIESTEVVGLFKPDLMQLIEKYPKTGSKILLALCEVMGVRLQKAGEKLSEISS